MPLDTTACRQGPIEPRGSQVLFAIALLLAASHLAAAEDPASLQAAFHGDFLMGVAINRSVASDAAIHTRFMRRTLEQVRSDTAVVLEQFNSISPENDLKWSMIHPRPGADGFDWGPADAFVDFGVRNNLYIVGHTLVWHNQTPGWVFRGDIPPPTDAGGANERRGRRYYGGPRASRDELLARMREHIHAVVGRYRGKVHAWDVVNEAVAVRGDEVLRNTLWRQIVGDDFIAKAFEYAHEADPDAVLRYNDYDLEEPAKRAKTIQLVKSLLAQGVPVMAIGTQTHISASSPTYEELDRTISELKQLGLPIHITELDVNTAERGQRLTTANLKEDVSSGPLVDEAMHRQATQYASVFKVLRKHQDAIELVTLWGVNDAVSWRANGRPLLFDVDNEPKPAWHSAIEVAETPQ